ncbi:hypothetical protein ACA910_019454 [Epithemia clementina (nom. ined.)]
MTVYAWSVLSGSSSKGTVSSTNLQRESGSRGGTTKSGIHQAESMLDRSMEEDLLQGKSHLGSLPVSQQQIDWGGEPARGRAVTQEVHPPDRTLYESEQVQGGISSHQEPVHDDGHSKDDDFGDGEDGNTAVEENEVLSQANLSSVGSVSVEAAPPANTLVWLGEDKCLQGCCYGRA